MRGSSILHGEGRKVPPVNLFNCTKRPLFARGLQSVRTFLEKSDKCICDFYNKSGVTRPLKAG